MFRIGGWPAYWFLKRCVPLQATPSSGRRECLEPYISRLNGVVGRDEWERLRCRPVVDFGCGHGEGAIELARSGFERVIGIDIRADVLADARRRAAEAGVANRCEFRTDAPPSPVEAIMSIDAFEHFGDPQAVLESMARMLSPSGRVIASFGPTWYHPRGGHLFSVFPWAHLIFSEGSLCRWRRDFRNDGAMRFAEVEGGLNQMTIRRFERLVEKSALRIQQIRLRPIRLAGSLHGKWTREILTSVVDCVLVKPGNS